MQRHCTGNSIKMYTFINTLEHGGNYMYHQFNIHKSTFCQLSVFMCFVWI
jgi:hypothetical protein